MLSNYNEFSLAKEIDERLIFLYSQMEQLEKSLAKMPDGNILVCPGNTVNSFRYYNRKTPQDKRGEYLHKDDDLLKKQLATKKYTIETIKNISAEIKKLEKIQHMGISDAIINSYRNAHPGVKKYIDPIAVDDETYIKMWKYIPYEGLGFSKDDTTEYYSNLGERMRSKSEVSIANLLILNNIPYKYECPIDIAYSEKLYPDFTILDIKRRQIKYWEHLGRMGDMSYVSKNLWKLDEYKRAGIYLGINLYLTFESSNSPMGTNEPKRIIAEILR